MKIANWQEITIDSETFDKVREEFDWLLQRLFKKMEQNDSDEGSITLKVDVEIQTDFIDDGIGNSRMIHKPVLRHKISTTVPVKDSSDGRKDTGMELVFDAELKRYVLKYVSVGGQRSIFDEEYADVVNSEATVVEAAQELPRETRLIGCIDQEPEESADGDFTGDSCADEESQGEEEKNGAGGDTEACDDDGGEDDCGYDVE